MKRTLLAATLAVVSGHALAGYPVSVLSSVPVTTQVVPALTSIETTLAEILTTNTEIGSAITQASDKNSAVVSEGFQAQRSADNFGRETDRLEKARDSFTVPDSICSESASGVAKQVSNTAAAAQSSLASGSGITNSAIKTAVSSVPLLPAQEDYRSAAIHAKYCTSEEYALYGGTELCESTSSLPGGDTEIRSVLQGAGAVGKDPDLTFTDDQVDAAMAYLRNSTKHSVGRTLGKGEINTATGWRYQGLMTQYKAIQNAAMQPQLEMIADSKPNADTKTAIAEALQNASAKSYYDDTASSEAHSTGEMSSREFESFEVGRRYANTDYETDLQAMDGDNLIRELIRVQSLSNWIQLGIKNEIRESNILAGQALSLNADRTYQPKMEGLMSQISAGVAK
ncbi:conjugal transfer protein TraW [Rouxiella badensis]|uniref:conjugal transfer protein TraW n=1 Tax=Rouxiella badensis TaxID=1646377 RepID=UPI00178838C4|nr:conjugal transfer protein TraW [Rouxiella badensis]QOI58013.1 conjugal transfer protein TraW [Rouxiella badensis subsp. acadiensis]